MEQFEPKTGETPKVEEAPKKRLNQKKIGLQKQAEKAAAEKALLEEEEKKKNLADEKKIAQKLAEMDRDFLPIFAERINGWLEIIDLSNLDQSAKNEFKLEILNSNNLIEANKTIKDKFLDFDSLYSKLYGFVSGIMSKKDELRRKGRGKPDELQAIFENIRDDVWAFRDENMTKKD
jgi:hypothetical protein